MQIQSWTARSPDASYFLIEMKVDGIIKDSPDYVDPRN
ncbi:hypothetical protein J7E32_12560 [Bacillus sp. ISL-55]|nr:hypothetical protein [Bacillus sp. ISL-55]